MSENRHPETPRPPLPKEKGVVQGQLWELAPTAMVALDQAQIVVGWNRAAERLFGYSEAEVLGAPYPLVPDAHRAAWGRLLDAAAGADTSGDTLATPVECERRHKNGRWLRVRIATARADCDGSPLLIKSFLDCRPTAAEPIPSDKLATASDSPQALRESQQRFRAFMDNIPLAAWEVDAENRVILANRACAWFTGHSLFEVTGKLVFELFPTEQAAEYRARNELVLRTGQTQEWCLSSQRPDGTPVESFIIQFPIPGPTGPTIGAIALNLTEHHLLREQIHQQAQLIAHGLQAVITCDPRGRIRSWNHGAELAFGYSAEQALNLEVAGLLQPGPHTGTIDSPPALLRMLEACDGQPGEACLHRQSGEPFFAQLLCQPLNDSEGTRLGTITYVQDITQRKIRRRPSQGHKTANPRPGTNQERPMADSRGKFLR